jgi:hypothetical protein
LRRFESRVLRNKLVFNRQEETGAGDSCEMRSRKFRGVREVCRNTAQKCDK